MKGLVFSKFDSWQTSSCWSCLMRNAITILEQFCGGVDLFFLFGGEVDVTMPWLHCKLLSFWQLRRKWEVSPISFICTLPISSLSFSVIMGMLSTPVTNIYSIWWEARHVCSPSVTQIIQGYDSLGQSHRGGVCPPLPGSSPIRWLLPRLPCSLLWLTSRRSHPSSFLDRPRYASLLHPHIHAISKAF